MSTMTTLVGCSAEHAAIEALVRERSACRDCCDYTRSDEIMILLKQLYNVKITVRERDNRETVSLFVSTPFHVLYSFSQLIGCHALYCFSQLIGKTG